VSSVIRRKQFAAFDGQFHSKTIIESGRDDAMFHFGIAFYEGRGVRRSSARSSDCLERIGTTITPAPVI